MSRTVFRAVILVCGIVVPRGMAQMKPKPPLQTGDASMLVTFPMGTADAKNPLVFQFVVPDPDDPSKICYMPGPGGYGLVYPEINVEVEKWPAKPGETQADAAKRKAQAIVDAVRSSNYYCFTKYAKQKADADDKIKTFVPANNPGNVPLGGVEIDDLVVTPKPVAVKSDPTKQFGNGLKFVPKVAVPGPAGGGGGTPTPGKSVSPGMSGSGMSSSGLDPNGNRSMVQFGFSPDSCGNTSAYVVSVMPMQGESDSQVFRDLAAAFNQMYASLTGHTAFYNPTTHSLSLRGSLPFDDDFCWGNTDTGLDVGASLAINPQPPTTTPQFANCPTVGPQVSGGMRITVNPDGSISIEDSGQPPYDGYDDTVVCVQNNSGAPVNSLNLWSPNSIFNFDGDGICAFGGGLPGCPYGPSGYEGPGVSLSGSGGGGTVTFIGGLAAGANTYFSLEASLGAASELAPSAGLSGGYFSAGTQGKTYLQPFAGPDEIRLGLPATPAGGQMITLTAQIFVRTVPVSGQSVQFSIVSGKAHFADSACTPDTACTKTTDDLGQTQLVVVLDAAGAFTIRASTTNGLTADLSGVL